MCEPDGQMERELFIEKFAENQQRIYSFVLSLAPNWSEAEEIFQRVSVVLWKKWAGYNRESEFIAWAFGVSRLEVLKHMSEKKRKKEVFSEDAIRAIEARSIEATEPISERMNALHFCLDKLPTRKRSLVSRCYGGTEKIIDVAQTLGLTSDALYWRLKRIRETLHECVDKTLSVKD
ncbi:MAG: sigma-70 family RNA polymerase sigma factor [Mariniblastus sp.]